MVRYKNIREDYSTVSPTSPQSIEQHSLLRLLVGYSSGQVGHLAVGSVYFVDNICKDHVSVHAMQRLFGQNFLPKRIFSQPNIITPKWRENTKNNFDLLLERKDILHHQNRSLLKKLGYYS